MSPSKVVTVSCGLCDNQTVQHKTNVDDMHCWYHKLRLYRNLFVAICILLASLLTRPTSATAQRATLNKLSIWPKQVYVGEVFTIRAHVTLPTNSTLQPLVRTRFGPARTAGKQHTRRVSNGLVIRIPLAVYMPSKFGTFTLPTIPLRFNTPQGPQSITLPATSFKLRSRYGANASFQAVLKPAELRKHQGQTGDVAHNYTTLSSDPTPPTPWMSIGIGLIIGLIAITIVLLRRIKGTQPTEQTPQIDPYTAAKQALQTLQASSPQTFEESQALFRALTHTLKQYADSVSAFNVTAQTAHEITHRFEQEDAPVWGQPFAQWLRESELIRFCGQWPHPSPTPYMKRALELIEHIHGWHQQQLSRQQTQEQL